MAICGGGFRATAFGLGCLRALHDAGLLPGTSGGSLLAALYAHGPQDFTDFDHTTTTLLRGGFQGALIRRALTPPAATRNLAAADRVILSRRPGGQPRLLTANRTDALRDELAHRVFGDRVLGQVTHHDLATILGFFLLNCQFKQIQRTFIDRNYVIDTALKAGGIMKFLQTEDRLGVVGTAAPK